MDHQSLSLYLERLPQPASESFAMAELQKWSDCILFHILSLDRLDLEL